MPESFIPLTLTSSAKDSGFVPLHLKLATPSAAKSEAEVAPSHSPETCVSPKVTLQRENDVITGIKIECACGQVIELACSY